MFSEVEMAMLGLCALGGLSVARVKQLEELYGSIWEAWQNPKTLTMLDERTQELIVKRHASGALSRLVTRMQEKEITALFYNQSNYPYRLNDLENPPGVLFKRGHAQIEFDNVVSIVGTRRMTPYGRDVTQTLAKELSDQSVVVVSGMADGIDTQAAIGALSGPTPTVAVLGCGVDVVYPAANHEIYERILENGCVLSEYMPGIGPVGHHFPVRNRIIAGLSDVLIVVEGELKSGTMHTVAAMQALGREVMAVPGNITSSRSDYPNQLISEGAKPMLSTQDVLDEMEWEKMLPKSTLSVAEESLTLEEKKLLDILWGDDKTYEELLEGSGFTVNVLNSHLTTLELRGIIKKLPGHQFRGNK